MEFKARLVRESKELPVSLDLPVFRVRLVSVLPARELLESRA